jgi:hypothetical protein
MNTIIITTHQGKTILLRHDVTSLHPYGRIHIIPGQKGFAQKFSKKGIAPEPNAHQFLPDIKWILPH